MAMTFIKKKTSAPVELLGDVDGKPMPVEFILEASTSSPAAEIVLSIDRKSAFIVAHEIASDVKVMATGVVDGYAVSAESDSINIVDQVPLFNADGTPVIDPATGKQALQKDPSMTVSIVA